MTSMFTGRPAATRNDQTIQAMMNKREADLAGGAYTRGTPIQPTDLSRYHPKHGTATSTAGMGFVQAILMSLAGAVQSINYGVHGAIGRMQVRSASRGHRTHDLSWDARSSDLELGGFTNGATYHAAIVGLVMAFCQWDVTGTTPEVMTRWWALLTAMQTRAPRSGPAAAWDESDITGACQDRPDNAPIRRAIEALADALYFQLAYPLPATTHKRTVYNQPEHVALDHLVDTAPLVARLLTIPTHPTAADEDLDLDDRATAPAPATSGRPRKGISGRRRGTKPTPSATSAPAPVSAPSAPPVCTLIATAATLRVQRAIARPGAGLFLYGVTATGKTQLAKQTLLDASYGLELIQFSPGLRDEHLFGTMAQTDSGTWSWRDGPVVRWARRATAGKRSALILDELARGHRSVADAAMGLLNTFSAAEITAQGLPVPAQPGPFHLVRVVDTEETLVVPTGLVKIVATANLGDQYAGLDLTDPAFRRRWTAGFYELAPFTSPEQQQILAAHLDLTASHPLVRALVTLDTAIQEMQIKDASLVMPTNLALLITHGHETLRLIHGPDRLPARAAFIQAAEDLWLDMLTPLDGSRTDRTVQTALRKLLATHADTLTVTR